LGVIKTYYMKTTLTKLYTQFDAKGFDQSELLIKVEVIIDKQERTATFNQLEKILAYNCKDRNYTDITDILFNHFHDQTESMIESIDWWEVWRETREVRA
jgi:hypothetical protein